MPVVVVLCNVYEMQKGWRLKKKLLYEILKQENFIEERHLLAIGYT